MCHVSQQSNFSLTPIHAAFVESHVEAVNNAAASKHTHVLTCYSLT